MMRREAIVVYRAPSVEFKTVRGRLRELQRRMDTVKKLAAEQSKTRAVIAEGYERAVKGAEKLTVSDMGHGVLPVAYAEITRSSLPKLAAQKDVVAILPNQRIHLIAPKEIDYAELQKDEVEAGFTWGIQQLGIPQLWTQTKGEDINVAVLDTGVYAEHEALAGRVKNFVVIDPLGRRIEAQPPFDAGRHGTHVCGTIAGGKTPDGVAIGVAPAANLHVAGVLVGDARLKTLMEGIVWAIEHGADIVNMSLGFSYYEPLFPQVFQMLIDSYGVLPVVAIGNENHGNSSSPGNAYNALSVGAIEKLPRGRSGVAAFSSGASLVFPGEDAGALVHKPDIVAPGAQVYSCIPPEKTPQGEFRYTYMDGTSMATPHVVGVAALLMAAAPEASVSEIVTNLKETALHPAGDSKRPDNRWGWGAVRPQEALARLGTA